MPSGYSRSVSQRDFGSKPKVARHELPWDPRGRETTPTGLRLFPRRRDATPLGLGANADGTPRVARARNPGLGDAIPLGFQLRNTRKALRGNRLLKQPHATDAKVAKGSSFRHPARERREHEIEKDARVAKGNSCRGTLRPSRTSREAYPGFSTRCYARISFTIFPPCTPVSRMLRPPCVKES